MRLNGPRRKDLITDAFDIRLDAFREAGVLIRPGEVSLTVSAPSVGKSQLWHNIVDHAGIDTLYWAADMTAQQMIERTIAHLADVPVEEANMHADSPWAQRFLDQSALHADWVFDPAITEDGLWLHLNKFQTINGEYPKLLVIDTIGNAVEDPTCETAEQKGAMRVFQSMARETGAHVAVLAHAGKDYSDGDRPIPQSGVLNNISPHCEVMLTLYWLNMGAKIIGLNVVKNRNGAPSDPMARFPHRMKVDYSRAMILGMKEEEK